VNILLLAPHPFFQHRGTPIAVKLLMEVLSKHGHNIQVLTYHEGEEINMPNVSIHRIPAITWLRNIKPGPSWKKWPCDLLMFWKCIKTVRRSRFDLIHAVEEAAFMAMVLRKLFRIPYVYDMDSSIPQQIADKYKFLRPLKVALEFMEKAAVRNSVGVIAVCKSLEMIALKHDPEKKVLRLEDVSLLKSDTQGDEQLFVEQGISGPIIMYVGNLESYQGIDLLLEGYGNVAIKDIYAQLVVIGGSDIDIKRYKEKSRQLGIGNKVHFIGRRSISQLGYYLKQADIVVSPRIKGQNTPMKIYSYLDSGKPLLATRISTHTQVLDDQIALLVKPEPEDMADGLIRLLRDNTLREQLSSRAKERVRQDFSYEAFQRKLLMFYKSLDKEINYS
jgi:Glycosyltransferase